MGDGRTCGQSRLAAASAGLGARGWHDGSPLPLPLQNGRRAGGGGAAAAAASTPGHNSERGGGGGSEPELPGRVSPPGLAEAAQNLQETIDFPLPAFFPPSPRHTHPGRSPPRRLPTAARLALLHLWGVGRRQDTFFGVRDYCCFLISKLSSWFFPPPPRILLALACVCVCVYWGKVLDHEENSNPGPQGCLHVTRSFSLSLSLTHPHPHTHPLPPRESDPPPPPSTHFSWPIIIHSKRDFIFGEVARGEAIAS